MTLTIKQVAERFGVSEHTALAWVASGELAAVNVVRERGGQPRWRVSAVALEAFEASRTHAPTPTATRRRRQPKDVIEFYR
jgi:excisionase family DNA binding protein